MIEINDAPAERVNLKLAPETSSGGPNLTRVTVRARNDVLRPDGFIEDLEDIDVQSRPHRRPTVSSAHVSSAPAPHFRAKRSLREHAPFLLSLRRYLAVIALMNLVWEFAHMPLYTIWNTGSAGEIVFAAIHCTGGDILIATSALVLSLLIFGFGWPRERTARQAVVLSTMAFGIGYTLFSEWLNIVVREAWAYSELMPVVPGLDAGLSPLLQWIVVPALAFAWALHPFRPPRSTDHPSQDSHAPGERRVAGSGRPT